MNPGDKPVELWDFHTAKEAGKEWAFGDEVEAAMPESGIVEPITLLVIADAAMLWAKRKRSDDAGRFLLARAFYNKALPIIQRAIMDSYRLKRAGIDPWEALGYRFERELDTGVVYILRGRSGDESIDAQIEQEALDFGKRYFWWTECATIETRWEEPERQKAPRPTISPTREMYDAVEKYRFDQEIASWSQAVLQLAAEALEQRGVYVQPYGEWGGRREKRPGREG